MKDDVGNERKIVKMSVTMRTLYVVVVLYLLSGLPNICIHLVRTHFRTPIALIHFACVLLGCCGVLLLWKGHLKVWRIAVNLAIGVPAILYSSQSMLIAFPTYFHIPLTIVMKNPDGRISNAGFDLIPAALFVLVWYKGSAVQESVRDRDIES